MSTPITTTPPAGSDQVVPQWDKNGSFHLWAVDELYMGPNTPGTLHYVGNVGDWAVNRTTKQFYEITALDPTTFVPTLVLIPGVIPTDEFSDTDRLLSPGPGPRYVTYVLNIDKSVKPSNARIDGRLFMKGTDITTCEFVTGSSLDGTQKTISAVYDQAGNLVSQLVPLETVSSTEGIKTVPSFSTTTDLADDTIVTAIFRSVTGSVASTSQLRVRNTAFIPPADRGTKYAVGIGLRSPFLSSADPTKINYPLNVPLAGLNLMGVVNYSDGSSKSLPVDGTKFQLFGFNTGFVATVIGQEVDLVLKYNLSQGESGVGVKMNNGAAFLTQEFVATTIEADGQYTVKLFCYPQWIDSTNGYRLRWFLMNLDRTIYYEVTSYIVYQNALIPDGYGVQQKIQVQLNLQKVNGAFLNFNFTQTVWISLLDQGTERTTNWTIAYNPGQSPEFGVNNYAASTFINQNLWKVNLAMGETDLDTWLDRTYYATKPLYDTEKESAPLVPDYFSILTGDVWNDFPISQWNQDITLTQAINNSDTLIVRFFQRTPDNDLQLAIAGFPIYQQN